MIKIQSNLGTKEDELSKDILEFQVLQSDNWEKTKHLLSLSIREIFWKAWIDPLTFIKYENKILHLSSNSALISNRAETQYYETIFFEASKYFANLVKINIHTRDKSETSEILKVEKKQNFKVDNFIQTDLSFVDSVSMKINSKLTFDNFVVGPSNQMPYAASKRICDKN